MVSVRSRPAACPPGGDARFLGSEWRLRPPTTPMPTDMEIAGVAVDGLAVIELADRLLRAGHMETAALLLIAHAAGDERVGLDPRDRGAIIDVLGDPPDALAELHDVLVLEHMSRSLGSMA